MAQDTAHRRPLPFTEAQVKDLAAGKSIGLGQMVARPRDVTAEDVQALREGKKVDLEKIPELKPIAQHY